MFKKIYQYIISKYKPLKTYDYNYKICINGREYPYLYSTIIKARTQQESIQKLTSLVTSKTKINIYEKPSKNNS